MASAGRKPIKITVADIKKIGSLAGRGLMDKEIMSIMGWSHDFFYKKKRELTEFNDAIEKGRASGHAQIANKLFESAMSGNVSAMQYYLARRAGWSEKHEVEHDTAKPVVINFVDAPVNDKYPIN